MNALYKVLMKKKESWSNKAIFNRFGDFIVIREVVIGMIIYEKYFMPNGEIKETTYLYIKTGSWAFQMFRKVLYNNK